VHLDEETRFNRETVHHCLHHCFTQDQEVAAAAAEAGTTKVYGDIGQGVIIYSRSGSSIENHLTTLADSIRVGDDYGKFRLQYSYWHQPLIGMHGSFVVAPNAVERLIGFDNGLRGSITEDAWFALLAWAKGVRFSWIDAHCFEQSPFTIHDFIMQRRRWFGGLWIVCFDTLIPFGNRAVLLFMIVTWALATLPVIVTASSVFLVSSGGEINLHHTQIKHSAYKNTQKHTHKTHTQNTHTHTHTKHIHTLTHKEYRRPQSLLRCSHRSLAGRTCLALLKLLIFATV